MIENVPQENFPVPKSHFLELVELCLNFQSFSFSDEEFSQIHGLAMGSPLSPVAACLYMEMMEEEHFFRIMGNDVVWYRYIDDVLVVAPDDLDLDRKLKELNEVERRIQFTIEKEHEDSLPFLDILIIKKPDGVKYRVYRKNTNKEDYIHYFSAHSKRIKSGVVIGFFLRAMRVCSQEYLQEECEHIMGSFQNLKYPKAFILDCRNKAKRIKETSNKKKEKPKEQVIIVPRSEHTGTIGSYVKRSGIRLIEQSGQKIGQVMVTKKPQARNDDSLVYQIPCKGCYMPYYGETSRGLKKRITEHKRDIRVHNNNSSLVKHLEVCNSFPDWDNAKTLKSGLSKLDRKMLESSLIEAFACTNSKAGDIKLAKSVAFALVEEYIG